MSELLTTGQAAALLGLSKPTLVRAVQRGQLRPALVTPGLHRRFRREDLVAYRTAQMAQPAAGVEAEAVLTGRAAVRRRDETGQVLRAS